MEKAYKKLGFYTCFLLIKRLVHIIFFASVVWCFFISPCFALSLISDEETELFLQKIISPLYKAAQIPFDRTKIHIVNDDSLNAFVSDGNDLFIHTGTIIAADSSNELSGVIAHETGHIMGGHIVRQKLKNQSLQQASLGSMILAGTAAAVTGRGDVAMAIALGGQSSTLNNFMQYRTEQERSADESAVKLLTQTKQSPSGMLKFMKKISKNNDLSGIEENPYFRTHPVTKERINFLQHALNISPYKGENNNEDEFLRVKAKLQAFLFAPEKTFRIYPLNNHSTAARYAHAIAYFKQLDINNALKKIDELIQLEPQNPFFRELKGQIYFETGKVHLAKKEYLQALSFLPNSALLQISAAQAIIEDSPSPADLQKAIKMLQKANLIQTSAFNWMLLSRAYGELGDKAYANYAAAEYSLSMGNVEIAEKQALNAKQSAPAKLKLKIDDLLARISEKRKADNSF